MMHANFHHYPSGGSIRMFTQFLQNYNSGEKFYRFDYGYHGNMKYYGTAHPPEHNLTLITAPVYLISAENDPLVPLEVT